MLSDHTSNPPRRDAHVLGGSRMEDLARYIIDNNIRNILCLVGAGASVAAGIPDFRSPNTGLYSKLVKYDLDEPSDAFSIDLLRESPSIFYTIARDMNLWPGSYQPTAVHHFIKLLAEEGRLLRCCTQNIDGLERAAGLPDDLVVEAHGSFSSASCIECHEPFDIAQNKREAEEGNVSHCASCGGIVKPDVVFFGENLPQAFFEVLSEDTKKADLVIIIGTSLQVRPFALLPLYVGTSVPRVLFNMERVGGRMFSFPSDPADVQPSTPEKTPEDDDDAASHSSSRSSSSSEGFIAEYNTLLEHSHTYRDLFEPGDCQKSVTELAELLGLGDRLQQKISVAGEHTPDDTSY